MPVGWQLNMMFAHLILRISSFLWLFSPEDRKTLLDCHGIASNCPKQGNSKARPPGGGGIGVIDPSYLIAPAFSGGPNPVNPCGL